MNISELKKHKFIVMCVEHYTSLGVIRSLGEEGIRPIVIIIKSQRDKVASSSKYIAKKHRVNTIEEGYSVLIKNYSNCEPKPFVIPCDDHFMSYLDIRMNEIKHLFYVSNANYTPGRVTFFQEKLNINDIAKKYGLSVAKTWIVNNGEIPSDIEYPVITKTLNSNSGGWKDSYHICNNELELIKAYKCIPAEKLFIQKFIKKKNELCLDGVIVNHGREYLCMVSKYTYIVPEAYSAEFVCSSFKDEPNYQIINKALEGMFSEIGYEGVFSLEFLIDENDDLWFLEENFRTSTWTYVGTKFGMNFILLWAYSMLNGHIPPDSEKSIPKGFKAMAELPDFNRRVIKHHTMSVKEWYKELKSCDCLLFYNKNDKLPLFTAFFSKVGNLIRDRLHRNKL